MTLLKKEKEKNELNRRKEKKNKRKPQRNGLNNRKRVLLWKA